MGRTVTVTECLKLSYPKKNFALMTAKKRQMIGEKIGIGAFQKLLTILNPAFCFTGD